MLSALDYDQIEPRLLAYFLHSIGHDRLVEYCQTTDPYTAVVAPLYGVAPEDITKAQRGEGKIVFLSLMYGAGKRKIAESLGLPQPEATKLVNAFWNAWPEIEELQGKIERRHNRRGYIVTPWGRQLHAEKWGEYKLLNKLIQGSAADIMKRAIRRVHAGLKDHGPDSYWRYTAELILIIHDEMVIDHKADAVEFIHEQVPVWMTDEPKINDVIPLTVGHEVTTYNWAEMEDYISWHNSESRLGSS